MSRPFRKNIPLFRMRKSVYRSPQPAPPGGDASRSSRNVGAGCDGTLAASGDLHQTKRGSVRRNRVVLAPRPWRQVGGKCPAGDGGKRGRSPGRAPISRKTIARGKPGCLGCTCQTRVLSFATLAHGAAGASSARLSLRPLEGERDNEIAKLRRNRAVRILAVVPGKRATSERDPGPITTGQCFAKAGAPVRFNNSTLWLWVPAFAGTTLPLWALHRITSAVCRHITQQPTLPFGSKTPAVRTDARPARS
jgi:hypothetical protein